MPEQSIFPVNIIAACKCTSVQVYDNPVLGNWMWKMRRDYRNKKLAQWKIDRFDKIEVLWKVDNVTAKWHANLHEARRYKVTFFPFLLYPKP